MKNLKEFVLEDQNLNKAHSLFKQYFDNFDFSSIPASERDKDPEDYVKIDKLSKLASEADLSESIIESNDGSIRSVLDVINELKSKYKMGDYQFSVYSPFDVQIITVDNIPNYLQTTYSILSQFVENNVNIIKKELERCGYYCVREEVHKDEQTNRKWVFLMFDPIKQESITKQIKNNCTTLYHCSPVKNHEQILQNGILASNEGRVYSYNSKRVYLLTADPKSDSFKTMMSNITKNRKKSDKEFDGKCYIYWIDIDELDYNIEFFQDAHGRNSIYTKTNIPVKAIFKYKLVQF